jgi:hypothetical protein
LVLAALLTLGVSFCVRAFAASIIFRPSGVEEGYKIDVLLDPGTNNLNAIEGDFTVRGEGASKVKVGDGNSIVSLWTERPHLISEGGTVRITWSGIIPGGFEGVVSANYRGARPGLLFSIFVPPSSDTLIVETSSLHAYENDGKATPVEMPLARIRFSPPSASGSLVEPVDTFPPEPFSVVAARDPSLYGNRWFAVFRAEDRGSGIDHYEMREIGEATGSWHTVESPALLPDQSRTHAFEIRAVDRAGNIRVERLDPDPAYAHTFAVWQMSILIVVVLALIFFSFQIVRRRPPLS